jgi:Raf kinase inhibitor-like YbhB/YbcL family protein
MRHLPNNRLIYFIIFDALLVILAVSAYIFRGPATADGTQLRLGHVRMKITSSAFAQDEMIPSEYTCDWPGSAPPLAWSDVPDNAKSLALIVDDPEAPAGTWTHWTVWNLPKDSMGITAGLVPGNAVQGITSAGNGGWHGPCPPFGTHRYFFKLYALDAMLDLPASATVVELERAMEGRVLDKAGLVGRYEKSNP